MARIGSEPELRDFDDYDTLSGEKKRVVWGVIIAGILIGCAFFAASKIYVDKGDVILVHDDITNVPLSKSFF
ncbi:hypothetical protein MNB_SM-5-1157 [hydrothermal vent metagenome]|uniref:Uncharacterized protein n=1 Tax=hydrothermal vent metagenome TaxID=652676 RepID=A0A1W1CG26_9ZZZZ